MKTRSARIAALASYGKARNLTAWRTPARVVSAWMVAACLLTAAPAWSVEVPEATLRYLVEYTGKKAGEIEIAIERDGEGAKTTVVSHPTGIAAVLTSSETAETWFAVDDDDLVVVRGQRLNTKNRKLKGAFEIDYQAGVVTLEDGETLAVKQGDLFESVSFPLILVTTRMHKVAGSSIREISTGRVRDYVYQPLEEIDLELGGKTYHTWKVTRARQDDPTRTATFWLDRDNHRLPVLIETVRKGNVTRMTLLD